MQITIAPAGTKTATATIQSLFATTKPTDTVKAVYRNLSRIPKELTQDSRFKAVQGDVSDATSLDFTGSDVVLAITPPVVEGDNMIKTAEAMMQNIKAAVEKAGNVKKLVLLSSIGAHLDHGTGEIKTNNVAEKAFSTIEVPEIVFVRCAYFMENWASCMATLREDQPCIFSTITPLNWKVPMVAVRDIGRTLASELTSLNESASQKGHGKPIIYELHGPRKYTPLDAQKAFSDALGKDVEVKPIEQAQLHDFFAQIFPPSIVQEFVEMSKSYLLGGPMEVDQSETVAETHKRGTTSLDTALKELVSHAM